MQSSIVIIRNISSAPTHYRSKLHVFGDFIMNTTHNIGGYIRHWLDKRKLVTILLTIVATIMLGYLFFLSWLTGFLVCKCLSSKTVGERSRVRSIIIPFRRWKIHLHHWLCAACLLVFSCITGIHLLTTMIMYGFLGGFVFQGIYCYSDWHKILVSRHKTTPSIGERPKITQNSQPEFAKPGDNASYDESLIG